MGKPRIAKLNVSHEEIDGDISASVQIIVPKGFADKVLEYALDWKEYSRGTLKDAESILEEIKNYNSTTPPEDR